MNEQQLSIMNREDQIAACFQAVIALQSDSPEVRRLADVDGLMNFLKGEYSVARGDMRRSLNS